MLCVLQRFPKHAKYRFAGPDHLTEMEAMFDKAYVNGALSTHPGPIDLTGGMEAEEIEQEDVVPNPNDLGGTSEPTTQTKDIPKRKRGSASNVDGSGSAYFAAYKATLDKWSAETSSVAPHRGTPTIAECMMMMRELNVTEADPRFIRACKMLKDADNREIFCNLQTPDGKVAFLFESGDV